MSELVDVCVCCVYVDNVSEWVNVTSVCCVCERNSVSLSGMCIGVACLCVYRALDVFRSYLVRYIAFYPNMRAIVFSSFILCLCDCVF